MGIRFDTDEFFFAHGKQPRGNGHWIFEAGGDTFSHTGSFDEARSKAKEWAKANGHTHVRVCS